ncbi:MAG: DUF6677 family protein [Pirellulales bacterium]
MDSPKPYQLEVDGLQLQLRRPEVAAFLAWLIPGAGHYYQRRYGKAALYATSILSLYLIGMFLGQGRVVYWSWTAEDQRWHFICQAGVGAPAIPAMIEGYRANRNLRPLMNGFMRRPGDLRTLDTWHLTSAHGFDLGTLYTMVAGILNILVIFDAYSGPLPLIPGKKEETPKS